MVILATATDPAWAAWAATHLPELLVDHAHCEKKAASTALSLCFRYPERRGLLAPLARLAREELRHFEQVLAHLDDFGIAFGHQQPGPYAAELLATVRSGEPERLLDTLLCMALIEARSCERLGILAGAVVQPGLAAFYRDLVASEARHYQTYVELADMVAPSESVRERLLQLAAAEAAVLRRAPSLPRLHAGA